MRSQVVNVGSSTTSSAPTTAPSADSKRSVFERLGRQIDSSISTLSPGAKASNINQSSLSMSREPLTGPSAQASSIKKRLTDPLWEASSERRRQNIGMRSRYIDPSDIGIDGNSNTKKSMDPNFLHDNKLSMGKGPQSPSTQAAPKYDRHGNLIISLREKRRLMNHHRGWPSSRRHGGAFFQHQHPSNRALEQHRQQGHPLHHHNSRGGRDYPFPNLTQYSGPGGNNHARNSPHTPSQNNQHAGEEASRYVKWRERRNAITSLDKEAARSNSRTNSLKSTLQSAYKDHNADSSNLKLSPLLHTNISLASTNSVKLKQDGPDLDTQIQPISRSPSSTINALASTTDESKATSAKQKAKSLHATKEPPTEMSDGEILDDDTSEEDIEEPVVKKSVEITQQQQKQLHHSRNYNSSSRYSESPNLLLPSSSGRPKERSIQDEICDADAINRIKMKSASSPRLSSFGAWEVTKMTESRSVIREDDNKNKDTDRILSSPPSKKKYVDSSVDLKDNSNNDNLETISDDEFDAMIDEDRDSSTKGSSNLYNDDSKLFKDQQEQKQSPPSADEQKSTFEDKSESELIKTLGIDWANLCDQAKKQSKSREIFTPGCARQRFTAPYYLKTLRISPELAGKELMRQINEICKSIDLNEKKILPLPLNLPRILEDQTSSNSPPICSSANEIMEPIDRSSFIPNPDLRLDGQTITEIGPTKV